MIYLVTWVAWVAIIALTLAMFPPSENDIKTAQQFGGATIETMDALYGYYTTQTTTTTIDQTTKNVYPDDYYVYHGCYMMAAPSSQWINKDSRRVKKRTSRLFSCDKTTLPSDPTQYVWFMGIEKDHFEVIWRPNCTFAHILKVQPFTM